MKNKVTTLERLYSCLRDYQKVIDRTSFDLTSLSQDLSYLLDELEQKIDEEKHYNEL